MSSVLVLEILLTLFLAVSPVLAKDFIRITVSMALTCTYSQQAVSQMNAHKVRKDGVNHKGAVIVKDLGNKPPAEFVYYDNESSPE
jgi:hypothetical protein